MYQKRLCSLRYTPCIVERRRIKRLTLKSWSLAQKCNIFILTWLSIRYKNFFLDLRHISTSFEARYPLKMCDRLFILGFQLHRTCLEINTSNPDQGRLTSYSGPDYFPTLFRGSIGKVPDHFIRQYVIVPMTSTSWNSLPTFIIFKPLKLGCLNTYAWTLSLYQFPLLFRNARNFRDPKGLHLLTFDFIKKKFRKLNSFCLENTNILAPERTF